ncbi:SDR family NAD(P)-dependent oxidoreductase [Tengunoibacter tsumagoiensis]|uniref:Short-chain dehydrogenase n=1 Tax=Tengunoibacter tsumagoiensis TaxID=2014871 RepID=A0A402A9C3_9CHLR|nr:SDR family oxidoreductase [Tengunoibacter tsumagoiensis]GCE15743.1 short-chain dehydrogenase [Tengunoibacter tsumagoiensis]
MDRAIVTGGTGQIGRVIVEKLLREGISVVIVDIDAEGDSFAHNCCAHYGEQAAVFRQVDIGDPEQVRMLVEQSEGLKYLVNNAVYSLYEPFLEISAESWEKVLRVGLSGYFYCSQAFARQLVQRQQGGGIVNVASINSFAVERNVAHYATAKGGVLQLTKAMAIDLATYDIRVNAVAPGLIETAKNREIYQTEPFREQIKHIPLQRPGRMEEIANIVHFLLTADHYLNGQTLLADGGLLSSIH